jgi:hypothetical protein
VNKSLLEQLPEIVRNGRRRVEQILESLEGKTRDELQTRELVTPARDSNWKMFPAVKTAGKPGAPLVNEVAGQGELAGNCSVWGNSRTSPCRSSTRCKSRRYARCDGNTRVGERPVILCLSKLHVVQWPCSFLC